MRRRLLLLVPFLVAACDQAPSAPGGTTTTRFLLTDAPFPYERLARADVYVAAVAVTFAGDTNTLVTVAEPRRRIDVMAQQTQRAFEVGGAELPGGVFPWVRLVSVSH